MTSTLIKTVDLPIFELCSQPPFNSGATAGMATAEDGNDKYIYYISASNFYRYDKEADTWQQLATPNTAPATCLSMRYTKWRGYHGRVLSASSNTVTIAGLRGNSLNGVAMRILKGTGIGQERTLTFVSETIHDDGVITATTTSSFTDSTKKWRVNEWAGYIVGVTFGTDATQYKKVLYNSETVLYFYDANLQPQDPWNNQYFNAAAPYVLPVITAGVQSHYQILSHTFSVPAWDVVPNTNSYFTTSTGGIYLFSGAAAAPFFSMQYYDILHDSWQVKTCPQSLLLAALGTDATIERTGKFGNAFATKIGTVSATARTLTDSGQTLTNDRYANYRMLITSGTGIGQHRRIVANTATTFTLNRDFDPVPDSTSVYEVWGDFDKIWMAGNANASMLAYSPAFDAWTQGEDFDAGICANASVSYPNWDVPLALTSATRLAAGVTAISSAPTAGGTGYTIGDVLTIAAPGTGATVRVTSIAPGGVVTGLELVHTGTATGYTVATGKATTGGTGTGCTVGVTAVGVTSLVTVATNHFFKVGDTVQIKGATVAQWNASFTILGVPGITTFCVVTTAAAALAAANAQSTTQIVDASQNWVPGEHVGRLVHLCVAGQAPTSQIRWITANTATTLTVATITAGVNGTSKYIIYDSKIFGVDDKSKVENKYGRGWATSGSTTTLTDSSKNWVPNSWVNYYFKVEAGAGYGSGRILITSNTETTLTYATQTFTPDATTKYEIADSWGLVTTGSTTTIAEVTNKNHIVNQWAGKRVRITCGLGVGQEASVTSNTADTLTTGTIVAPDATSSYAILGAPAKGAGIELIWIWGGTNAAQKGRGMFLPRGSLSNTADFYDIPTGRWRYGYFYSPQAELFTTGSCYAYDGVDTVYCSKTVAGYPMRIFAYDMTTNQLRGAFQSTVLQSTATVGNVMEIVTGGEFKFLYFMQATGSIFQRALIF